MTTIILEEDTEETMLEKYAYKEQENVIVKLIIKNIINKIKR